MTKERKMRFEEYLGDKFVLTFALAALVAVLLVLLYAPLSFGQQPQQRTFQSDEEASLALFMATQQENERALLDILGPAGKEVISSGDPAQDMNERVGFVVKFKQMHRLVKQPDGKTILYTGADNSPFPIPLASKNGAWYFDTEAGREGILARRISDNELAAKDALRQLIDAEKQYFMKPFRGQPHYTARFVSEKGKHNGLYWSEAADEFDSAIDPLIASAGQQNTSPADAAVDDPIPFNGYYFRILTRQGNNAPNGAKDYIVDGKMVAGFAFIAYPSEYGSSGAITFIVDKNGVIYEKDLGPDTTHLASEMTDYDPDPTWHRAD